MGADVKITLRNHNDKEGDEMWWKLKACPHCGGDVFIDKEPGTWYEQCLQCGYQRELRDIRKFKAQAKREKESALARRGRPSEELNG